MYFFFKLSAQTHKQPKTYTPGDNFFYKVFLLFVVFLFFLFSSQHVLGLETLLSSSFELSLISINLIFFFFFLVIIFLELLRLSSFRNQLNSLLMFVFLFFFSFFFMLFFSIVNHFELLCIFEYINALLVLYILISTPTLKPTLDVFKSSLGKNTKFLTSYFFLPALINYFFLLFIISIFLFYFYVYVLMDLSFVSNFSDLAVSLKSPTTFIFFFIFLVFKLGVAPLHFWKLEIFESFRLVHFSFFSTLYFVFSLFFFEFILSKMALLSCKSSFSALSLFIFYNIFFCFFHINTALNIRQFLVLSALLNLNLALLSLLLSAESTQPFFLFFVSSYAVLAFIFYFYFLLNNSKARFFSNLGNALNKTLFYFFFLLPLFSLGGVAPSLSFFYKLSFLLTNLQEESIFLLTLYILSIIVSVIFYLQLFKTSTKSHKTSLKGQQAGSLDCQHLLIFFLTAFVLLLSIPLLGPTSYYLLDSFSRLYIALSQGI